MRVLVLCTVACLLIATAGCSDKTTTPNTTQQATSATPADILEILENNTPNELDMAPANHPTLPSFPPPHLTANCDVYAVTFLWGQFHDGVSHDVTPLDWSGRLWVNGVGVVHPRATINFEPDEDYIVEEEEPAMAAWVSFTARDIDGISFLVFMNRDVDYIIAPTLHFETEPISLEFDFGHLIKLDATYILDDHRNGVAIHARKIWPHRCPGGFMEGRWIRADNTGDNGRIEGVWMNSMGEPEGHMNGEFAVNEDGHGVFHGWVSGWVTDDIKAEFEGTWWYDDAAMCITCGTGHGWFRGHFKSATGDDRGGHLAGEIGRRHHPPDPNQLELPYHGVWHLSCPWDHNDIGNNSD